MMWVKLFRIQKYDNKPETETETETETCDAMPCAGLTVVACRSSADVRDAKFTNPPPVKKKGTPLLFEVDAILVAMLLWAQRRR